MTLYIKSQVFLNSKTPKIRNVKDLFKESKSKKNLLVMKVLLICYKLVEWKLKLNSVSFGAGSSDWPYRNDAKRSTNIRSLIVDRWIFDYFEINWACGEAIAYVMPIALLKTILLFLRLFFGFFWDEFFEQLAKLLFCWLRWFINYVFFILSGCYNLLRYLVISIWHS